LMATWMRESVAKDRNVVLFIAGPGTLEAQALEAGHLVFSRGIFIDIGIDHNKEARISLTAYRNVSTGSLDELVVVGPSAPFEALAKEEGLPLRALELPLSAVCDYGASAVMDLTPPSLIRENAMVKTRRDLIIAGAWLVVIALCLTGLMIKVQADRKKTLVWMEKELQRTRPVAEEAQRMRRHLEALRDHAGVKPLAVEVLSEVYRLTPEGITLGSFDYEDRRTVALRGQAKVFGKIAEYARALEGSPQLSAAEIRFAGKRPEGEGAEFEIQARLEGSPDV
jgi:hypothetical protein